MHTGSGATKPPIQWIPVGKVAEADRATPTSVGGQGNTCLYIHFRIRLHDVVLKWLVQGFFFFYSLHTCPQYLAEQIHTCPQYLAEQMHFRFSSLGKVYRLQKHDNMRGKKLQISLVQK
jgi:hypothetical protein